MKYNSPNKRVILERNKLNDNSFKDSRFGIFTRYSQSEMRDNWFNGISHGFDIGYNTAYEELIENRVSLVNGDNSKETQSRVEAFNKEFYDLSNKYGLGFIYIFGKGLCIEDLKKRKR